MNRIIVTVSGGVVQGVSGVPTNCIVEVRDFDVDGVNEADLEIDDDGDKYVASEWTASAV